MNCKWKQFNEQPLRWPANRDVDPTWKEKIVAPVLRCPIERVRGFDTDQRGTFTRDIPRFGTQLGTARRKARIGVEISGLPAGLASEGSVGVDPMSGLLPWSIEWLVLLDDRLGVEVLVMTHGPATGGHLHTDAWSEVEAFARAEGFPSPLLAIRPSDQNDPRIVYRHYRALLCRRRPRLRAYGARHCSGLDGAVHAFACGLPNARCAATSSCRNRACGPARPALRPVRRRASRRA